MNISSHPKSIGIIFTCLVFLMLMSCHHKQEVSTGLFEINREVTCEDLVEQGFAWMPGEDVILFGRRTGDTLDYYHMDERKDGSYLFGSVLQEDEFREPAPDACDNLHPYWRYIVVEIDMQETGSITDRIDQTKYTILKQTQPNYTLFWAKVVNKETLDTFTFSVYERDRKYFVSSSIRL
ncbi:hypothetical protein AB9P05_21410 [Roseivirga sp. BDSF3-8]|uniref:hypothetical protein n=1 Tax=Roseivirga sp. BDSF3-8 TaxID=3241598 RepID=UPI0035319526